MYPKKQRCKEDSWSYFY